MRIWPNEVLFGNVLSIAITQITNLGAIRPFWTLALVAVVVVGRPAEV